MRFPSPEDASMGSEPSAAVTARPIKIHALHGMARNVSHRDHLDILDYEIGVTRALRCLVLFDLR